MCAPWQTAYGDMETFYRGAEAHNSHTTVEMISTVDTQEWQYVSAGVWSDPRRNWWIKILRTLNLSVQSFLNRDIQSI